MNEKLVLSRSPTYWDHANTVIRSVTYLTLSNAAIDLRRYQAGEIDVTNTIIPTAYLLQLPSDHSSSGLHITPALSVYGYKLNTRKPPFNDKRVRQALALGLDRQALVTVNRVAKLLGQIVASSVNSPKMAGFLPRQPSWAKGSLQQRQQLACQYLREAGYSSKRPLRFSLLYNLAPLHERWAIAVSAQWKACFGSMVDITLEGEEWRVFLKSSHSERYQAARFFWTSAYPHPTALLNLFYSPGNRSATFWHSPDFDRWMDKALHSLDEAERRHCYQQAELILAEEAPVIPLYHSDRVRLVKPYVGGLSQQNPMNAIYTKDLYLMQHPQGPSRYRQ
jgi:oligopeptide transport system substrate-binding protein